MTLRHLHIFNTVCTKMSITKAAEELNMTQPAVSIAIKELEVFYNTVLFDRIGRKIYLTDTGKKLRNYSHDILSGFNRSVSDIRDENNLISCKIGANATIGETYISLIAKEIKQQLPDIILHIEIANNSDIEDKLINNAIDFALIDMPTASHNITLVKMYCEEMIAVCSPEFTEKSRLNIDQLSEMPCLLRERGSGCRLCVESEFGRFGIQPNIFSESISNQALIALAEAGFGITILPKTVVRENMNKGKLKYLIIENVEFIRQYNLAFLSQKFISTAVKHCMDITLALFDKLNITC